MGFFQFFINIWLSITYNSLTTNNLSQNIWFRGNFLVYLLNFYKIWI